MTNEFRYFLESTFIEVNKLSVLVYLNQEENARRINAQKIIYQKVWPKTIMWLSMEDSFMTKQLFLI